MWRGPFALFLLVAQALTLFLGVKWLGKSWGALPFTLSTMALGWHYLASVRDEAPSVKTRLSAAASSPRNGLIALASVVAVAVACGLGLADQFAAVPNYIDYSDVIPQNVALFERTMRGEYPYYPVPMPAWSGPFPVYMPLHWLPVGIAKLLSIDVRWSGAILLLLACTGSAWLLGRRAQTWWAAAAIGPAAGMILLGYLLYTEYDLPVSYDLHIAGYYIVLSLGLALRQLRLIALGLVLCFLSRYTLVFWMPTVVLLMLYEPEHRREVWTYLGVLAIAVLVGYVLPFVVRDPMVLFKGVEYHNDAAIAEWRGYGGVSYSMEVGAYFAHFYKANFQGDMAQRLFLGRVVQGALMLALMAASLWGWWRLRCRVVLYDYLLFALFMVIAHFYLFGVLTYRYYYVGLFGISFVMVAQVLARAHPQKGAGALSPPAPPSAA